MAPTRNVGGGTLALMSVGLYSHLQKAEPGGMTECWTQTGATDWSKVAVERIALKNCCVIGVAEFF
jgi:hypothetical protein